MFLEYVTPHVQGRSPASESGKPAAEMASSWRDGADPSSRDIAQGVAYR